MCAANEEARRGRKRKGVDGLEGGGGVSLDGFYLDKRIVGEGREIRTWDHGKVQQQQQRR